MKWVLPLAVVLVWCGTGTAHAQDLPRFTLKDPVGRSHCSTEIGKYGLVLVVTAPILSCENFQKGWDRFLPAFKPKTPAQLFFIEDMTPSLFKEIALSEMKKGHKPGGNPTLLIDTTGSVRRALGVAEKKTVVLVFNASGKLVFTESGRPSAASAKKIWMALQNG